MNTRRAALWFLFACAGAGAQQYTISSYAGGAPPVPIPVPGTEVSIGEPISVATDGNGNVYFASPDLNAVFKLDASGVLTRVAGSSKPGYSGDGGDATSATMNLIFGNASAVSSGLAVDQAGNLFIADTSNHSVRRVSPGGIITTVAGTGTPGFSGDGGPAVNAQLAYPWGVAVDPAGNLFILDTFNYCVRKVSTSGIINTLARVGGWALAVDGESNVFVSSPGSAITKIAADGTATTMQAVGAWGMAVDSHGNLFIADGVAGVRKISPAGTVTAVAGNGKSGYSGDGGAATSAQLSNPSGVAVDSDGNLFLADRMNFRIRKVSTGGSITTVAGNGTGTFFTDCSSSRFAVPSSDAGPAINGQLRYPLGVAVDAGGNLYIADTFDNRVRKVARGGNISTIAGTGSCGFSGDGAAAAGAQLSSPYALAVDSGGNLFIADTGNQRIRKVSPDGIISTVAGNGTRGLAGDGGPATGAQLNGPYGLAVDSHGNLFIADSGNYRVRRVSPDGIITTAAGNGNAPLTDPSGVAVDSAGNLYIADGVLIRKVSPGGTMTTVAGGTSGFRSGFSGDGGPATSARLSWPVGVAVDSAGNLFIADPGANFESGGDAGDDPSVDNRIRKVSPDGIITTIAGNGSHDFSGDGGAAISAALDAPVSLAADGAGNVYVADLSNNVVRILGPANSSILIGAVVDAASQRGGPVSPGKIVVIYGAGLGPPQLIRNQPKNGQIGTELGGTTVSFNGVPAPILYSSATQAAVAVPYATSGSIARVSVTYQGQVSPDFAVPVAMAAPGIFTLNQAGWGQAAAINADGTVNTPANPVGIGGYISLYVTGEGQTVPAGVDGKPAGSTGAIPALPVTVTVGGIPAVVQYAGSAPGQVAGLMQVNLQIPAGAQAGGYVPVVLRVGKMSTTAGAVWIAVEK